MTGSKLKVLKLILKQLKKDLWGKDSHRGITLTYAWLANQFGHFSLGFIPSTLLYYYLGNYFGKENWLWFALSVTLFWTLFEIKNLTKPILSPDDSAGKDKKEFVFIPKWKNLIFDTVTDIGFFALGAFTGTLFLTHNGYNAFITLALLLTLVYPSIYWYLTKMYQQYAFYPYQLRLCQWNYPIDDDYKDLINHYVNNAKNGLHLVISGKRNISNSKLGICVANELSIKHNTCFYTSAVKLGNIIKDRNRNQNVLNYIWDWNSSKFLIIDDVDSKKILNSTSSDPLKNFNKIIKHTNMNLDNDTLLNKNIIWVISYDISIYKNSQIKWVENLIEAGVDPDKILSVTV